MTPPLRLVIAVLASCVLLVAGCASSGYEDELQLGHEFARDLRRSVALVEDEEAHRYLAGLGGELVRAAGPQPFRYRFFLVAEPSPNAFVGPAAQVYVTTGAVRTLRNADGLAAVLAHEIGHAALRHIVRRDDMALQQQYRTTSRQARRVVNVPLNPIAEAAVAAEMMRQFGHEHELEADHYAVELLAKAGYEPDALVAVLADLQRIGADRRLAGRSSHPQTHARITAVETAIAGLAEQPRAPTHREGFPAFQRRVAELAAGSLTP